MAGRVTISAGNSPVLLTGMDATNATAAYTDIGLTTLQPLPLMINAGSVLTLYVADSASITPTVKDASGAHTMSAVAVACRAGSPVNLGPFNFTHASIIA